MSQPESLSVPVHGGELAVLRWAGDGPVVLAVHGITANALFWARVAELLDGDVTLVAPDLRGRAGSNGLPGPYGMRAHADDLVAVLDHLGVQSPLLVGHSMGGFVATMTAVRNPDRVAGLVLVDGGVGFPAPAGTDIDAMLDAVIGPAMARLRMTFPDREAYRDFWRAHPAIGPSWDGVVDACIQRDLVGEEPALRSSCALEAVRVDGAEVLADEETLRAVHELSCPATILWAPRGLLDEPQGLYDERRLAAAALDPARVSTQRVEDVNHYTVLLDERGAEVVAEHVRRSVAG
jgi:pimeloyl-ACP methyl ester carboxylesterase